MRTTNYGDSEAALASLKDFYPLRASLLAEYLVIENSDKKLMPKWREQQIVKFTLSLTYNVDELITGFHQKRIWKVAWAARNLLELGIWVEFCNNSPHHAKQFRDDSARDLLGTAETIQAQFKLSAGEFDAALTVKMDELRTMVRNEFEVPKLKADYTRVLEAARTVGRENDFIHANKLLSKYAHPTAIALNSSLPSAAQFDAGFRDMFLSEGAEHGTRAITLLREEIVSLFPFTLE